MRPLTSDQWARNRGDSKPARSQVTERSRTEKKREEEKKKDEKKPDGQVVDVAKGNEEKAPDAKYLAEHDNKVQKETKAREQTPFYRNAMPQQTAPQAREGAGHESQEQAKQVGNNGIGADDRPMAPGDHKPAFEVPDAHRKQEIALKPEPDSQGLGP